MSIIKIDNLKLKFPRDNKLLFNNLSLTINKGEKVLILGPTGSGKSTLLKVLTGIIPNQVEVPLKVDKINIPESLGFLFQDPDTQFCMPFIDEEIAFVLENQLVPQELMIKRIKYYLKQVGVKLDNNHVEINKLSGGTKQRVAIASILALEPEVLFLDEPTSMLDTLGTKEVWDTIKSVGKDKTIIIVEHKIDQVIDFIERVILFDDNGNIIADNSKDYVFNNYKKLINKYGIWHPGSWGEYSKNILTNKNSKCKKPILSLKKFAGFRNKKEIIRVEEANVYKGDWIVITGVNGSGKSTFLYSLMQLIKTKGQYKVNNMDIKKIDVNQFISFVFQNPEYQFVTNSVHEELAYSLRIKKISENIITEKINKTLSFFQLEKYKNNHPYNLSMGQKRRLSVATAIINDQSILLLDEPTFGQDAKNTFKILNSLEELKRDGKTIIMVSHDLNIIRYFADREWNISDGMLQEKL